jgi:hypothetical protein
MGNYMLSEIDVRQWISKFDLQVQESLEAANKLEPWVLDDDPDVKVFCNRLSLALGDQRKDPITGETVVVYNYDKLANVSLANLTVLQGQLSFVRGIKLFGDVCFFDRNAALKMLGYRNGVDEPEKIKVASSLLSRRIQLLISLQLIERIFNDERRVTVKELLRASFSNNEVPE